MRGYLIVALLLSTATATAYGETGHIKAGQRMSVGSDGSVYIVKEPPIARVPAGQPIGEFLAAEKAKAEAAERARIDAMSTHHTAKSKSWYQKLWPF